MESGEFELLNEIFMVLLLELEFSIHFSNLIRIFQFFYYYLQESVFRVDAGTLGFSVSLYAITAIICVGLLMLRRSLSVFGNAELGGPNGPKYVSGVILCILWFVYVLFSALQAYGHIKVDF